MKIQFIYIIALVFLFSCTIKSEKIQYGQESCHFCKMIIVDSKHGAEIVNNKGKVFKFDAIECMIRYSQNSNKPQNIALQFVNYYEKPGDFIKASEAIYLKTPSLPSPMGENLTAFKSKNDTILKGNKQWYTWQQIQDHLKIKDNNL